MLGKILLTLSIIIGALVFVRIRQRRQSQHQPGALYRMGGKTAPTQHPRWGIRGLAALVVVLMLATSGFLLYQYWRDSHQVIQLRVIDAATGQVMEYSAYRGEVSAREFMTLDGVQVILSEHDRIEINRSVRQN